MGGSRPYSKVEMGFISFCSLIFHRSLNSSFREIPRAYHGAVLCNEKMIIFGGFNGREYFQHAKLFDLNKKVGSFFFLASKFFVTMLIIELGIRNEHAR